MTIKQAYDHSREFITLIESKDWQLISLRGQPEDRAFSWEELEQRGITNIIILDEMYLFAPKPKVLQSRREAYATTKGFGPTLIMRPEWNDIWIETDIQQKRKIEGIDDPYVLFSRIIFTSDNIFSFLTPPVANFPTDFAAGNTERFMEMFIDCFRITKVWELSSEQMPYLYFGE